MNKQERSVTILKIRKMLGHGFPNIEIISVIQQEFQDLDRNLIKKLIKDVYKEIKEEYKELDDIKLYRSLERLDTLFLNCNKKKDYKSALDTQKYLDSLIGIRPQEEKEDDTSYAPIINYSVSDKPGFKGTYEDIKEAQDRKNEEIMRREADEETD